MRPIILAAALAGLVSSPAVAQTSVPTDAFPSCTLSDQEWQSWQAATAGVIEPADSTTFDDATDCNFYKWGAQMFLWITSNANGTLVYNGPDFYDVTFSGDYGTFVPQGPTHSANSSTVRTEKEDDDNDTGVNQTGGNGVLISPLTTLTGANANTDSIVHYGVKANNVYAYYRTGQFQVAFDNTLQNYFPTDANDLSAIEKFMKDNFDLDSVSNGDALAIELKSSWVEASILGDLADVEKRYITSEATISTFDGPNNTDTKWPKDGTKTATMAMVGLHVVGSVKGHPELVWATFEHVDNAPQNNYVYLQNDPVAGLPFPFPVEVPYDGNGGAKWSFNADSAVADSNLPVLAVNERSELNDAGDAIEALTNQTIGPDKVVRLNPWGDAPQALAPNMSKKNAAELYPGDGSSTPITRATDLISLNASIIGFLGADDVRANYIQTGSIWSKGGTDAIPTSGTDPNLRGNLQLANSTMETFHQYPDSHSTGSFRPKNCFGCHSISDESDPGVGVSHLIGSMLPLSSVD